ncbi:hypothetical protein [Nocardioides sp. NPDC127503]|uniref:hypothetical protein n=1 Tax=Nocardioides sp. NPDC127503 TaxID=3154516 RepID=UPI0033234A41
MTNVDRLLWPNSGHDLLRSPGAYLAFSDLGWQRRCGIDYRAVGFRRGAAILYDAMLEGGDIADLDTVFYPYALCWRHYVELQLKVVLASLRALGGLAPREKPEHSVGKLWSSTMQLMHDHMPDLKGPDTRAAGRVIGQLDKIDPNGQEIRYGARLDGTATLPDLDRVNLSAFHEAMCGVANYLEGVEDLVEHHLEVKREMDGYYAAEFGVDWSDVM